MAEIVVNKIAENQLYIFEVIISEKDSQSRHRVSLNKADYQHLTDGDVKPEKLIRKAFEYLLSKEPKERILKEFDFTLIGRYFPNFTKEIKTAIYED